MRHKSNQPLLLFYSLLIAIFVLVSPTNVKCQWTNGTNISNTNTGNVGVGTGATAPLAGLHVAKGDANGNAVLIQKDTSSSAVAIGTINNKGAVSGTNSNATSTGDLLLNPYGGNVGIGTSAPYYKFDIFGGANRNTLSLTGDGDSVGYAGITINALTTTNIPDNRTAQFKLHMRKDSWYGGDGSGPSFVIESVSRIYGFAAPFIIAPNNDILLNGGQGNSTGSNAMSYGNVGVGNTNPSQKLDVNGVIKSRTGGFMFPDGSVQTTAATGGGVPSVFGRTGTVVAAANDYTWAQINKTTSSLADIATRSASDLSSGTLPDARFPAALPTVSGANLTSLNASNIGSGTVPAARLGGGTANTTTYLRGDNTWVGLTSSQWTTSGSDIKYATGNVGIGISGAPTAKLDVNGTAHVSSDMTVDGTLQGGNIKAKYQDVAEWVPVLSNSPLAQSSFSTQPNPTKS